MFTETSSKPDKSWSCLPIDGFAECAKGPNPNPELVTITGDMVHYEKCFAKNGHEDLLFCSDSKQELASGWNSAKNSSPKVGPVDLQHLQKKVLMSVDQHSQIISNACKSK